MNRALALVALTGCSHVYSPPARLVPLETATPLLPGETGLQLEGGVHGDVTGAYSGTLRLRHGFLENDEASLEGSFTSFNDSDSEGAASFPNVLAGRTGFKHRFLPILSVTAGLGLGASAGGVFVSPDVGVLLSYDTRILTPFLSLHGSLSQPLSAQPVLVHGSTSTCFFPELGGCGDNSTPDSFVTPQTTWIAGAIAGLRFPFGGQGPGLHGAFSLGVGLTWLTDSQETDLWVSGATAVEVVF